MIKLRIKTLIFLILIAPFTVGAQTFKCKNTDGKTFYSDSKCPADTTLETTIQSSNSLGVVSSPDNSKRRMPSYMPDETCVQENKSAAKYCGEASISIAKQCMRERLSPSCVKQYESGPGAIQTADEGCKQEIRAAATPCTQNQITSGKQCIQERLSSKCRDQTGKFNTEFEKFRKKCEDAMLQLKKVCPSSGDAFNKCMQEHQAEIKGACNDY
jgi:hypothetical protein